MKIEYQRDKRSPRPKNEVVSKVMSANKAKNTKPEKILRKKLWAGGLKGYRLNNKSLPGTPDITFPAKKLAIFVHGCYWHRCPDCNLQLPNHNSGFWQKKFEKNVARDLRKRVELENQGWEVLVIWECEIKNNLKRKVNEIEKVIIKQSIG